jgi:hypothetical protein
MFDVGDLVRFKSSNIQRDRLNPNKRFGIVVAIEKNKVKSLWKTREDILIVRWMPWDKTEKVMGFYLEPLNKTS